MSEGKEGRKHRRCVPSGSPRQEFLRIEELNGPAIGGAQNGDNKKQKLQEEQEEELYPSPLTPYHFTLILQVLELSTSQVLLGGRSFLLGLV